jgi:hypothetical protein
MDRTGNTSANGSSIAVSVTDAIFTKQMPLYTKPLFSNVCFRGAYFVTVA